MDEVIKKTLAGLKSRHIEGYYAADAGQARERVFDLIPSEAVVGIGDSTGLRQLGLTEALKARGTELLDGFGPWPQGRPDDEARREHDRTVRAAGACDVFLTGTNAVTQDGRLVNVDAVGNRVAGMVWGHPLSVIVVGRNKIVRGLDQAFDRIRNVIAPNHARIRAVELGAGPMNTPCAKTGKCGDCRSADRICNVTMVIEGKPFQTRLCVVIVDQDYGLGWDETWPPARIEAIIENYKKHVWLPPKKED